MPIGERFKDALVFAVDLHREQIRKGTDLDADGVSVPGIPYASHLLAVASLVMEARGDEDEVIGALLHDAIEDQPRGGDTERAIAERFGPRVLAIVKGCTKEEVDRSLPPARQQVQRRAIRRAYFEHLRGRATRSVLLVSAADKLHNARAMVADLREHGPAMWRRFNDTADGTLWYYREVARALDEARGGTPRRLVEELQRLVAEMERV
jgi:(p)ppGpp synthase/HD superfamily hydrolase